MTYSSGQLIQASDYNTFAGASAANVSTQLNTTLGIGRGNAGYGQTAVSNVTAVSDTVTATQWTTMLNGVNKCRKHQAGAGFSNIGTVIAGDTISAIAALSSAISDAYTNRLTYTAQGTTVTGSTYSPSFSTPNTSSAQTYDITRTVTFASADQARYFFNAGGQINFVISSVTNNDGTQRSASLATLAATNFGSKKFGASDAVARTGSGATLIADLTTGYGYYGALSTSDTTMTDIQTNTGSYSSYANDHVYLFLKNNGVQGSNADNGTVWTFTFRLYSGPQSPTFNDSIDITVNHRIDILPPSTTYLSDSWGSIVIA